MNLRRAVRHGCQVVSLALGLTLFTPLAASAQVAVPALTGHVIDHTGTLTAAQSATLEQALTAFEASKGAQVAVLIVPSTAPEAIEPYALRVAEQWKLGRKKIDDGVILVVAKDDRAMRIEVGYGLEGALSDITAKRIISDTITPSFKRGDYYGGLQAGTAQIMQLINGEPLPEPQSRSTDTSHDFGQFMPFLFILAVSIGGLLRVVFGKVGGAFLTGAVVTALAWWFIGTLIYAVLAGLASAVLTLIGAGTVLRGVGGGYSGRSGGWNGGGGFRGGGGGFGGGGASGRW